MATVPEIISSQQAYVGSWVSQADAFINQVAALANTDFVVTIPDELGFAVGNAATDAEATILGLRPDRPDFGEIDPGDLPTAPVIDTPTVTPLDIAEFTGVAPVLDLGTLPSSALPSAPSAPTVRDPSIPSAPTITLPVAPTLTAIALPEPPSIELPAFTATTPIDDLVTPTNVFAFAEVAYQSVLLDAIKSKHLDALENGGYGIEPDDEQALFDRARAREQGNVLAQAEELFSGFAARGFPLPPGEAHVALQRVVQDGHNKLAETNRTIALERSRLYVENRQFTLRESRELEATLINYHNALMERALNAARATLDAAVAIFNTQVARYNARIQAYQVEASVFESRIRAVLSQVQIYKTQIEAANLELDAQKLGVDIYRAQLAGVQSEVDIYRARMEAANVQAQVEATRIAAFRGLVDAYQAQVQTKVAEFNMYESRVRGQVARVEGFRAEVDAYRATADAAKSRADIQVANLNALTERARVQLASYQASIEAYRANLDSQTRVIDAQASIYRADTAAYGSVVEGIRAAIQAQTTQYDVNGRYLVAVANSKTERALAQLKGLVSGAELRLGASKFGADFYRGVVSATLGSINTLAAQIQTTEV